MKRIIRKTKRLIKNLWERRPSAMFSRVIVLFCIGYMVYSLEWAKSVFEQSFIEPSAIITGIVTGFGGELLFLCLNRIFSKKDERERKTQAESQLIDKEGVG